MTIIERVVGWIVAACIAGGLSIIDSDRIWNYIPRRVKHPMRLYYWWFTFVGLNCLAGGCAFELLLLGSWSWPVWLQGVVAGCGYSVVIRSKIATYRPGDGGAAVPIGFELAYDEVKRFFFRHISQIVHRTRYSDKLLIAETCTSEELLHEARHWVATNEELKFKRMNRFITRLEGIITNPALPLDKVIGAKIQLVEIILSAEYASTEMRVDKLLDRVSKKRKKTQ